MKKCVIWGIGAEYDKYVNCIQFEILKGNFVIEAYVSKDKFCSILDGKPVINAVEISKYVYDYIIVCNTYRFKEIKKQAVELGINPEKLISCELFGSPCFDFNRYVQLLENKVTIISDDCWGAVAYNYLKLPFSSPFILCYFEEEDYIKVLQNLKYYLEQPLMMEQQANMKEYQISIGSLGREDKKILVNFNHSASFELAEEDWNRRIKRINKNNLVIKMTITNDIIAEKFDKLPYENKVGFYDRESRWNSIYDLCEWRWNDEYMRRYYGFSFSDYVRRTVTYEKAKPYDLLKLLNGKKILCGNCNKEGKG